MNRVLILGGSGAGKSTLAANLGARLNLPVTHLDRFQWLPGWKENDKDDFRAKLDAVLTTDQWVIDGNYSSSLPQRIALADTIIFLDFSRFACLYGALTRVWKFRGRSRPNMTAGCNERMTWEFFLWIWNYNTRSRPGVLETLSNFKGRTITLRSRREINAFLASLP